ncbi:tetratricopeptide repeat protein [Flagellimonas allohymeniacidonis]|uniref:histidine kinase n=1 Tax=Flagellimonas allohymeniacidonis TaxID=2517819 RepID=A0A4Q8QC16_9FLAO|nr:tetratricopeptide repeat protein [Allomuricauda hymeniacidonis]TAI47194.1 tetratricopeptide repeat protein [Allomuricauda hymeniacidonis]
MKYLYLLLFFLSVSSVHSQSKTDSLQQEYAKAREDTIKIKILHQLFSEYSGNSSNMAQEAILEAMLLSEKTDVNRLKVTTYNHYADYLRSQSLEDSALAMSKNGFSLAKKINYREGVSEALIGLGASYWRKGNFEKASEYLEENIELAKQLKDSSRLAKTYNGLASIYTQKIEYSKAMQYFTLASTLHKATGNLREYSKSLGNIGFVQRSIGNYENAKNYLNASDQIAEQTNFLQQRAFSAYNLSIVYRKMGELDSAILLNKRAISIYSELGNKKRVGFGEFTMGKIYWEKKDFGQALNYYKKSLEISRQVDDSVNIGHSYEEIAKCYRQLKNNNEAKRYSLEAIKVAEGIKLKVLAMNAHEILTAVFAEEGNYEKAYESLNQYTLLRESIYTKEKVDLASEIEAKYQNEQKTQEIELLESEKELQNLQLSKRENERNAIVAFAIILLLLGSLLYNQYRLKKKTNNELRELDKIKSNFFANISHEFRTPLTLIKGPIEQLEQNPDEGLPKESIKMVRRNTNRVLQLVNQLLDLSKIDQGKLQLEQSEGEVYKCLRGAASSFNSHAAQRKIDYRVQIPHEAYWASFDRDKLEKILYNLLGNAFKFCDDGAIISIVATAEQDGLRITISDTGPGISEEKLPFIFDRFYQVQQESTREHEGSGIGLSLSKELVELMDGTITASSEVGKGTIFTVVIPIQKIKTGIQTPEKVLVPDNKEVQKTRPYSFETPDSRNLPVVLLVEDNPDMSHFIKEQLQKLYRIHEAKNGKIGLEMARSKSPNLIVTDVMMPEMDGVELCKRLKSNLETSHIPIVMLTAKAGIQNKIEGLETGADDYLTKPFESQELLARVKNLIEQRKRLRERYSKKQSLIDPKEITVNSLDQNFLEQLLDVLEKSFSDPDFGTHQMQEALAMSKTQLHRKTKALTNETPGELLRNFRLKRAAQLLAKKADTVTQIAYAVGFNNLSYFAKCFKELYGVTPSSY